MFQPLEGRGVGHRGHLQNDEVVFMIALDDADLQWSFPVPKRCCWQLCLHFRVTSVEV
jgi:hypothetical protein